jgi:Tfp pilus assembly protein PilF
LRRGEQGAYHCSIMFPRCLLVVCLALLGAPAAFGQGGEIGEASRNETLLLQGNVYGPDGRQLPHRIRIEWQSEDGFRPVSYLYTDSNGRFQLPVRAGLTYTFTVPSDEETYQTATVSYIVPSIAPRLDINLRPMRRERIVTGEPAVSVSELQQEIPPAALKLLQEGVKHLEAGRTDRARPALQRAVEIFPDYVNARNELAVALLRENKLAEAETHLLHALGIDSNAARVRMNLGVCLYRLERYAEAIPHLEKGLQLMPGHARGQLLLGAALERTGQPEKAEPALLRAYELSGASLAEAQLYLARVYLARHDYTRSAEALETYLRDVPNASNAAHLRKMLADLRELARQASNR